MFHTVAPETKAYLVEGEECTATSSLEDTQTEQLALLGPTTSMDWRLDISHFLEKKVNEKHVSHGARKFYRKQNMIIDSFLQAERAMREKTSDDGDNLDGLLEVKRREKEAFAVKLAINLSFAANIFLLVEKCLAAVISGSLAIIASAIDSSLDIVSGSVIFFASHIARKKNQTKYPIGRTRLEPISIIIFASVMAMAALQLLREAVQVIINGVTVEAPVVHMDPLVLGILISVVAIKLGLMALCYGLREASPSVDALFTDHRNDVVTNSFTIVAVILASRNHSLWLLDPTVAILLALLIFFTWVSVGLDYTRQMSGRVGSPELLSQLTYLAYNHDYRIQYVDTVRAYHIGHKLLAELDIVLPPDMPLREAHDIGESLQKKLECLEDIERAYVHLDYEYEHRPDGEHQYPH